MLKLRKMGAIPWKIGRTPFLAYNTESGVYGYPAEMPLNDPPVTYILPSQAGVARFVDNFRTHGHKEANLDPLGLFPKPKNSIELDPRFSGLDPASAVDVSNILPSESNSVTVEDLEKVLRDHYCGQITAEFMHLTTLEERDWFAKEYESLSRLKFTPGQRLKFAELMLKSQNFDNFLATKFSTVKRYGGEGAESAMAFYWQTFLECAKDEVQQIMIGIAHRGRLNLLTLLLEFPPVLMFQKMRGQPEFPPDVKGSGDVLSHLVSSVDLSFPGCSNTLHVTMLPNPSHLEAVDAMTAGKVRGRLQSLKLGDYCMGNNSNTGVLCLQIHGDASFSGQGIVPETLALSQVPHFRTGGSLHLIINNQVGFTTEPERGRSSDHCSDLAKSIQSPVIHVNGADPELLAKAAIVAMKYRQRFEKDVFVNMFCFRRWGHNEMDDPSFTQPIMYDVINSRKSIPDDYAEKLIKEGILTEEKKSAWISELSGIMTRNMKETDSTPPRACHLSGLWSGLKQAPESVEIWDTGADLALLKFVGAKSVSVPENMTIHPHLSKTHCDARLRKLEEGRNLDWATAEALGFGSLLLQGFSVRISGQDVGRGTFSQRHCMLVDRKTDLGYVPLNHIWEEQTGFLEVANSILSEEAVMGFEYGMSIESPKRLVIWEAQFGDFMNGAQIIIDACLSSGEAKWLTQSGLVLLLPHGYDGAGPEHSSCRLERFLQLTDSREAGPPDGEDVNMGVVCPTTPAQYFHLLRRQVLKNYRKPLVIVGPKILLRLPAATSTLDEMGPGTYFRTVIGDSATEDKATVNKVIVCSGKHFYALQKHRESKRLSNTAIIRLECLCPFPAQELQDELNKYPNASTFVWSQEEPRNMGPWFFVSPRMENILGIKLKYAGRPELPIVATPIGVLHQKEADEIIAETFQ